MAEFVILGLSTFGQVLAQRLYSLGEHVLVIDQDRDKIQQAKDFVNQAIVADAVDKRILEKLIKETTATVVVSLGDHLEHSVMVTYYLKELGVKKILAKANSIEQGQVLQLVGATDIIYPERDMAIQIAERLSNPGLLSNFPVTKDHSIVEFAVLPNFVGKSLINLKLRNTYGINVLLIKKKAQGEVEVVIPSADYIFQKDDTVVALGNKKDINNLPL